MRTRSHGIIYEITQYKRQSDSRQMSVTNVLHHNKAADLVDRPRGRGRSRRLEASGPALVFRVETFIAKFDYE